MWKINKKMFKQVAAESTGSWAEEEGENMRTHSLEPNVDNIFVLSLPLSNTRKNS